MPGDAVTTRPLVLLVDDVARTRELAARLFTRAGCAVLDVEDSDDAVRQFRSCPAVDLVWTDVRLKSGGPDGQDKSGLYFARYVKKTHPDLPVAVYSSIFRQEELDTALFEQDSRMTTGDFDVVLTPKPGPPRPLTGDFDVLVAKGSSGPEQIKQIEHCAGLAREYRLTRQASASAATTIMNGTAEHHTVLREFTVGQDQPSRIDQILRDSGYRLNLIEVRFDDAETGSTTTRPAAVWVLERDSHVEVELYQRPAFHVTASTVDAGLSRLAALLREHQDALPPLDASIASSLFAWADEHEAPRADDAS